MRAHDSLPNDMAVQVSTGDLPDLETVRDVVALAHRTYRDVTDGTSPTISRRSPGRAGPVRTGHRRGGRGLRSASVPASQVLFTIQSSQALCVRVICEALGHARPGSSSAQQFRTALRLGDGRRAEHDPTRTRWSMPAQSPDQPGPRGGRRAQWEFVRAGLSRFAGRELEVDEEVCLGVPHQRPQPGNCPVVPGYGRIYFDPRGHRFYTRQCSLDVTIEDFAVMSATFADGGVNPVTQERVIDEDSVSASRLLPQPVSTSVPANGSTRSGSRPRAVSAAASSPCPRQGRGRQLLAAARLAGNSVRGQLATKFLSEALGSTSWSRGPSSSVR